jgi:hypothetical protein
MSRLTKDIRDTMARKLVAHRYTDEAKELARLNRTLADRAYAHCYPAELVAHMDAVQTFYPDAFRKYNTVRVNAGGFDIQLGGNLRINWVSIPAEVPKVFRIASLDGTYHKHAITDTKLAEDIKAFAVRREGFNDVCKTAFHEALSVLHTVTTGKKLAEAWPEAMPVIGDLIPENQRTLPVVQVAAINAKFKLPPETKAAAKKKK